MSVGLKIECERGCGATHCIDLPSCKSRILANLQYCIQCASSEHSILNSAAQWEFRRKVGNFFFEANRLSPSSGSMGLKFRMELNTVGFFVRRCCALQGRVRMQQDLGLVYNLLEIGSLA